MENHEKTTLKGLQEEMEAMRADYEAKLAEKDAQLAEKKRAAVNAQRFKEFLAKQDEWLNEYVEVRLFKDNEKYKDDVYVAVNGHNCVIRRGVWTRIRRKFAMLLDQSEIQDLRTAELMEQESNRFSGESRLRNL